MSEVEQLKSEGNAAFVAKDFDKAVDLFTQAINASETPNHVLFSNRSGCYASLKKWDEALKDADECIKINPQFAKGYGRKGTACHGLGDLVSAKDSFEEALKIDPNNAQAKSGLKNVDDAIAREAAEDGQNPDMGFGQMFNDPNLLTKLATNPKTKHLINKPGFNEKLKMLQSNPMAGLQNAQADPDLMAIMSVALGIDINMSERPAGSGEEPATKEQEPPKKEQKKPEPKKEEPKQEVNEEKKRADEEKQKGNALYKQRQFDEAITHYTAAWEICKDITYLNNKATAEFEKGDYDSSIKTSEEAIEYARENFSDYKLQAKAYGRIGSSYLKKDNWKEAINFFNKSLTEHRNPDTLKKLRETEKALKAWETESYKDPTKAQEAREEGNQKFKDGDAPGAVKCFDESIKRAPEDPRGYGNRAAAYLKLMNYPDVVRDCDTALELDPAFMKAYTRKASALKIMREYKRCLDTLEQARKYDTEGKYAREINEIYNSAASLRFERKEDEGDEEFAKRMQQDPEIYEIITDPAMSAILQQASSDPAALRSHMNNPEVARKVNLLIAAGIIKTR